MSDLDSQDDIVLYDRRDRVAVITLNRPEALNTINQQMREALPRCLNRAEADDEVGAIVLAAAGDRAFSAGADVTEFAAQASAVEIRHQRRHGHWIRAFDSITKPVVAAIHGYCLGGGLEMAMAADIRIACTGAIFGLPELSRGTMPGAGGTQRLPRLVGLGKAVDMILTGERIGVDEAMRIGLITRRCAPEDLLSEAEALARLISGHAPVAVRHAKEAMLKGYDMPLADALALELDLVTLLMTTEDRKEAGRAFRDKRKPNFKGK